MESQGSEIARKRMKSTVNVEDEGEVRNGTVDRVEEEEIEASVGGSEEMENRISCILEKIENFTQLVSELLESGKTMFRDLSSEFEERMIMIHKEQIEKWQEEIRELRLLDVGNEDISAVLHHARRLIQNVPFHSSR